MDCDYCNYKGNILSCPTCGIKMCYSCYNATSGGECHFTSKMGVHHFPHHSPMSFYIGEIKADNEDYCSLSCKTYVTFMCKENTTTIINIKLNAKRLTSFCIDVLPSTNKTSLIQLSDQKSNVLEYVHSIEVEDTLKCETIKWLMSGAITCKRSDFSNLLLEFLECIDHNEHLVNEMRTHINSIKGFKFITFKCIISPYTLTSTHLFKHLSPALVLWCGDVADLSPSMDEDETISKLREMAKPFKNDIKHKYSGIDYSMAVTLQHVSNTLFHD